MKNIKDYAEGVFDVQTGLVKFRNVSWHTNMEHGRRHQPLQLMTMADNLKFSRHKEIREFGYRKYDNYDAIEVPYTDAIPSDYFEDMGVPISYLDKHNPDQFEIVKFRKGNDEKDLTYTIEPDYNSIGSENYALLPNHHQAEGVTASLECRSPSSTSTTPSSSKLWEQQRVRDVVFPADYGMRKVKFLNL